MNLEEKRGEKSTSVVIHSWPYTHTLSLCVSTYEKMETESVLFYSGRLALNSVLTTH